MVLIFIITRYALELSHYAVALRFVESQLSLGSLLRLATGIVYRVFIACQHRKSCGAKTARV